MATKLLVPSPATSRDAMLRTIRSGLIQRGVTNPNVTKDSDWFVATTAYADQLSPVYANQQVLADDLMPDTAEDVGLVRWLDIFDLAPRAAQPASGNIVLETSAATFVATGRQLLDGQGQTYEVTTGGTYSNGATIPVRGVSTGKGTDHPQGYPLQWVGTVPSFANQRQLVGLGGLTGGADIDTSETSRNRLFDYMRNPPQGANWTQIATWAVEASASVQAAYVYRALNGPATVGLCVLGGLSYDTSNGWTRAVPDAVVATVASYVAARMDRTNLVTTTPKDTGGATPDVDASISIGVSLPLSVAGGGPGGGWIDADPWPDLSTAATRVYVSSVTSSTVFTLTSDDPGNCPTSTKLIAGETQIAWFSSTQFADGQDPIVTATVTAVSGSTGAIQVTVSVPFSGIASGDYVMPNSVNVQTYAAALLASMGDMGAGQWTSHAPTLIFAARRPLVTASNPSDIGPTLLRAISDAGEEVTDVAYLYRSATNPGVPANTTTASPFVFVPKTFALMNKIP
jgi:hypothetical protein